MADYIEYVEYLALAVSFVAGIGAGLVIGAGYLGDEAKSVDELRQAAADAMVGKAPGEFEITEMERTNHSVYSFKVDFNDTEADWGGFYITPDGALVFPSAIENPS